MKLYVTDKASIPLKKPPGPVRTPQDLIPVVRDAIAGEQREYFLIALLNTRHFVFRLYVASIGSLNAAIVHPREIFREAIRHAAASILLAHVHPSGDPTPSEDDLEITQRLCRVGEMCGIEVLDHVIVCKTAHYSFKEAGLI